MLLSAGCGPAWNLLSLHSHIFNAFDYRNNYTRRTAIKTAVI
jgi:hypothetical protein